MIGDLVFVLDDQGVVGNIGFRVVGLGYQSDREGWVCVSAPKKGDQKRTIWIPFGQYVVAKKPKGEK